MAAPPTVETKKNKRWFPLESNPQVMNKYIDTLGVPTSQYSFYDVFSTEEWAFSMIPSPVIGVLVLFPIKDASEAFKEEECSRILQDGQIVSKDVYFMKQTVSNACGTVGILHAVGNARDQITFRTDSFFPRFLASTLDKTPLEMAALLEANEEIEQSHGSAAQSGQTELEALETPLWTHFIAFNCVEGHLYELDGRKEFPINHGPSSPHTLLPDACRIVEQLMARDPGEMRFTIVALARTATEDRKLW
jgi:ubiquitin carboxyl-terminal hydrolase L3